MKRTPGRTYEEREHYWIRIISEARRYPDGIIAYLERQGIRKNNYYRWFKRLSPTHPEWKHASTDSGHPVVMEHSKKGAKLPKTEVTEKAQRRRFSPKEKARILDEFENAEPGKGAAVLRREGIYSSQIRQWRLERDERSLEAKKRGPKPNPAAQEIKKLKAQLAKAERKLSRANAMIELQKKVAEILKTAMEESDDEE